MPGRTTVTVRAVTTPDSGSAPEALAEPPVRQAARYSGGGPALSTDPLAVAALALSFVLAPVAVVLALVALRRIGRSGQGGHGLAITALVVSGLWVVLVGALLQTRSALDPDRDGAGTVTRAATLVVTALRPGDCVASLPPAGEGVLNVTVTPCTSPHRVETYAAFSLPEGRYPGDAETEELTADGCEARDPGIDATGAQGLTHSSVFPGRDTWGLNRTVICLVESPVPVTTRLTP